MARHPLVRAAVVLLVGWAALCAVVLATGWLLTHALVGSVDAWDDEVARAVAERRTPGLSQTADVGTLLADTPVGMGVAAVAAVGIALWRRHWLPVALLALATLGLGAIYKVGTSFVERDRPPVRILDPGLVPDHSFPSGHVGTAVGVYAATAVVLWLLVPRARPAAVVLAVVPLVVGACRVYQGAHHVSDVVLSLLVALAWLALVTRVVAGLLLSPGRSGSRPRAAGAAARA